MVKTVFTLALAASALALAAPAGAKTIDNWDVATNAKSCTMVSTFADDVTVGLIWSKTGELGFITTLPRPNGVRGRATAPVQLTFDGDSPMTQWEDDRAAVVSGPDNDALIANWGAAHSDELARAVKAASHVKLRVGGKDVGTYDLSGSPAAYRRLSHCGEQLAAK